MLKKRKIEQYLIEKKSHTIFDELLKLYISNDLMNYLKSWELSHISIYVEFKNEYRGIDIQARYHTYFYEWQFDENECSYMVYTDNEPDEPTCFDYSMFGTVNDLLLKMKSSVPT